MDLTEIVKPFNRTINSSYRKCDLRSRTLKKHFSILYYHVFNYLLTDVYETHKISLKDTNPKVDLKQFT